MSGINLQDPQVLANFIKSQIAEGNGEYVVKEQVLVFKSKDGMQHIVPEELQKELNLEVIVDEKAIVSEEGEKPAKVKKATKKAK